MPTTAPFQIHLPASRAQPDLVATRTDEVEHLQAQLAAKQRRRAQEQGEMAQRPG